MSDGATPSGKALAGIGIGLLVLSGVVWLNANGLPPAGTFGVGPGAALRLTAVLLLLLAAAHLVSAWRQRGETRVAPADGAANKAALAWGIGGMAAMIAIIAADGGFVLAATTLFVATARAFGKPVGLVSIGLGLALSLAASLFFTQLLSLSLPVGPIETVLYQTNG